MKYFNPFLLLLILTVGITSCEKKEEKIKFTFLQLNDVYEIAALEGGEVGGMDRVETLHQQLLKENPNTFMFMAGDFLNPSLIGNIKYEGERVKGKQMIEVMNAMNFDLVAFGNHEFDLKEKPLQKRLDNSDFQWIATNLKHVTASQKEAFYKEKNNTKIKIPKTVIFTVKNKKGTSIKIGFFSATINSNPKPYVEYADFYEEAKHAVANLKPKTDLVFGLTHLKKSQDKMLANMLPEVPLIMGGHEHTNMLIPVGNSFVAKADANAKTVYVHKFEYNVTTKQLTLNSELVPITSEIASNKKIAKIIKKWQVILDKKIEEYSSDAYAVIYHAKTPLNGEDHAVRGEQTNLGAIITKAMIDAYDEVDGALINGGSIRLDDQLRGNITGVDIFRVLPFGGSAIKVKLQGSLLKKVLDFGRIKKGTGAYLQRGNFTYNATSKVWYCSGKEIIDNKNYTVVFSDYLLKGYDIPFLNPKNSEVLDIFHPKEDALAGDIRRVVINYLKTVKEEE